MARIVRKYGGSSLRETTQIQSVAKMIADMSWNGDEVVVVVSAMAATTDELINTSKVLNPDPPRREMDMLLSTGERVSCALLAMALEAEGVSAVSYTGSQVGIITDNHHGEARIVDVRPGRLVKALQEGKVVVVAGFQGVSIDKEITTLGRGGSDATAIALAATINADRCELMKDVDGLYTAHPEIIPEATIIETLDHQHALELARGGTRALQSEAARLAADHNVTLAIGNSSTNQIGTIITDRPFDCGEIVGIAKVDNIVRKQGTGPIPDGHGWQQIVEHRGRWILWREASGQETAPFSALSIITSGRPVDKLYDVLTETLKDAEIASFGIIETESRTWVCVRTEDADQAMQRLYDAFCQHGWLCKNHKREKLG